MSSDLVAPAIAAIEADRAYNDDPAHQREYDNISYCPDLRDKPPISELLTRLPARALVDRTLGWNEIAHDRGQIAIRQAQTLPADAAYRWHRQCANGLAQGNPMSNFTAIVGVFPT